MRNQLLFLLAAWLMLAQPVNAQLIGPGDSYELSFADLPYAGSPGYPDEMRITFNISPRLAFDLDGNLVAIPNGLFNVDLFENADSVAPFFSERDTYAGSGMGYIFSTALGNPDYWSDREGRFVVWATDGDFELAGVDITLYSNGAVYQQSFATNAVPVPAAAWLLASGLLTMFGAVRFRQSD